MINIIIELIKCYLQQYKYLTEIKKKTTTSNLSPFIELNIFDKHEFCIKKFEVCQSLFNLY